jgi:hypothetical protein
MHGAAMRHAAPVRSGGATKADSAQAAAPTPTSAPTVGPTAAPSSAPMLAPIESTIEIAARKLPPGLVRVAARLEAMGVEGRTGGQSNALERITRNLQRYVETQEMATPPAPLPEAPVAPPVELDPGVPESSPDTVTAVLAPPDAEVDGVDSVDAASESSVEVAEATLI